MPTLIYTSAFKSQVPDLIETRKRKVERVYNLFWDEICSNPVGYLGLDCSLGEPGFCYSPDGTSFIIGHFKAQFKGTKRLKETTYLIKYLLKVWKPKVIFLEDYSFDSPFKAHDLGELGGFIRTLLDEYVSHVEGSSYTKIAPASLKLFVAGSGRAKKIDVQLALKEKYKFFLKNDNEADALALCTAAIEGYVKPIFEKKLKKKRKVKEKGLLIQNEEYPKKSRKKKRNVSVL